MYQVLLDLGGVKVYGFGLMLTLSLLASVALAAWRAGKEGLDASQVDVLAIWVLVAGLVGARLFYVVEYHKTFKHWYDVFQIWQGGIVLYGSILGGAVGFWLYRRQNPFPIRPMMDAIAPALALGIAIGRMGCFLNGCCYGDLCDLPWAVTFPGQSSPWREQLDAGLISADAARSLPIHPTQLYSVIDGLILMTLCNAYFPRRRRDGEVFALLMVTYPITRFLIERLRNDEAGFVGGLTISQAVSVVVFVGGLAYWGYLRTLPVGRHADKIRQEAWPEVDPATAVTGPGSSPGPAR